jgi:hypothetical protein
VVAEAGIAEGVSTGTAAHVIRLGPAVILSAPLEAYIVAAGHIQRDAVAAVAVLQSSLAREVGRTGKRASAERIIATDVAREPVGDGVVAEVAEVAQSAAFTLAPPQVVMSTGFECAKGKAASGKSVSKTDLIFTANSL